MKNIFFSLIILIFLPKTLLAEFIEIQDAGINSINGIYIQSGTYNNKPRFVNGIFQIRFNYNDVWEIRDKTTLYENTANDDLPPTNGWSVVNGLAPTPVLYLRPAINYSKNIFNESENNIGQIDNSIPVTFQLENAHFSGNNGDIFPQSHVMIENMPSGLTPVITRQNSQTLTIEITGNAIHHDNADDCSNIIISFQDNAFNDVQASSVINAYISDFSINFIETITVGKGFLYSTITQAISHSDDFDMINLAGDIFTEQVSINKSLIINGQSPLLSIVQAAENPYSATTSVFKIYENCDVILRNMTIRNGNNDGGIENRGRLWMEQCAVTQNQSNYKGGGISSKGPLLHLSQCTVYENRVTGSYVYGGGGIYIDENTTAVFNNCTISGNTSDGNGGGILNEGIMNLDSCTIYYNTSDFSVNNLGNGGGIFTNGTSTLKNTILAGNSDLSDSSDIYNDFYGEIESLDYNLIEKNENNTISGETTHCVFGASPNLKPLAYNGGRLKTHAFYSSTYGPAINSGETEIIIDERGASRPCNGSDDIGAYEACSGTIQTPPDISLIPDIQCENNSTPITVLFRIADAETPSDQLNIHITTDRSDIISTEQISISKQEKNLQMIITLTDHQFGTASIVITVTDASNLTACTQFQISVEESFHLDIDGDGVVNALSDGLLIIYYLNDSLDFLSDLSKIVPQTASRKTKEQIKNFLDKGKHLLDIDDNGTSQATTDGILLLRYLFEIDKGVPFVDNLISEASTRKTDVSLTEYIESILNKK